MKLTSNEVALAEELAHYAVTDADLQGEVADAIGACAYLHAAGDATEAAMVQKFHPIIICAARKCLASGEEKWAGVGARKVVVHACKRLGEIYAEEIAKEAEETKKFWENEEKKEKEAGLWW